MYVNGHHWAQRQAAKAGIGFAALDNGFLSCDEPGALQRVCDGLNAERVDSFVRKWLAVLPHPFTAGDRAAGFRYELSILQAEFSVTAVVDRPRWGRAFFDQVIAENLTIGRPTKSRSSSTVLSAPAATGPPRRGSGPGSSPPGSPRDLTTNLARLEPSSPPGPASALYQLLDRILDNTPRAA